VGAAIGVAVAVGALAAPRQAIAKIKVRPKAMSIVSRLNLPIIVHLPVRLLTSVLF